MWLLLWKVSGSNSLPVCIYKISIELTCNIHKILTIDFHCINCPLVIKEEQERKKSQREKNNVKTNWVTLSRKWKKRSSGTQSVKINKAYKSTIWKSSILNLRTSSRKRIPQCGSKYVNQISILYISCLLNLNINVDELHRAVPEKSFGVFMEKKSIYLLIKAKIQKVIYEKENFSGWRKRMRTVFKDRGWGQWVRTEC